MKNVPDVLGMTLSRAEAVLRQAGIPYRPVRTAPPSGKNKETPGRDRVIRQSSEEDTEILLICEV